MNDDNRPAIAVLGVTGKFGSRIVELLPKSFECVGLTHDPMPPCKSRNSYIPNVDITNSEILDKTFEKLASVGIRTLINCVGDVQVDAEEYTRGDKESRMYLLNTVGPGLLAKRCQKYAIRFIHFSTEYVFDGKYPIEKLYCEMDVPNTDLYTAPTWYGVTKALGEERVQSVDPNAVIIRFAQLQSPTAGLFVKTLRSLRHDEVITRAKDQYISPIVDATAVRALLLVEQAMHKDNFRGIIHIGGTDAFTTYKLCLKLAEIYGILDKAKEYIRPEAIADIVKSGEQKVARPLHSVLDTGKFFKMFGRDVLLSVKDGIACYHDLYPNSGI